MPRPDGNPPPDVPPQVIDIEIDFDGTIVWDTAPRFRISRRWIRISGRKSQKDPQPEIHLRPDRRARYDVVANVMASAQRNKMVKMGFTNVAEFRD